MAVQLPGQLPGQLPLAANNQTLQLERYATAGLIRQGQGTNITAQHGSACYRQLELLKIAAYSIKCFSSVWHTPSLTAGVWKQLVN